MITTFVIPVIDTTSGSFNFNGNLSTEQYANMIVDNFNKNYDSINNLVTYGMYDTYTETFQDKKIENVEEKFNFHKTEAYISDVSHNDINTQYLDNLVNLNKKGILRININPNSMETEAIEEINYWLNDSKMVLNDNRLDKQTIIMSLPIRDFLIDDGNQVFRLCDCKLMEINSTKQAPFSFALLFNKIIHY